MGATVTSLLDCVSFVRFLVYYFSFLSCVRNGWMDEWLAGGRAVVVVGRRCRGLLDYFSLLSSSSLVIFLFLFLLLALCTSTSHHSGNGSGGSRSDSSRESSLPPHEESPFPPLLLFL
jgi:hypothetical protein